MNHPSKTLRRHRARGFTLIETLCVVAVAGVLSSVAYPGYLGSIAKARRADALAALMQVQIAQERFRSGNLSYGSLAAIGVASTSPAGLYTLAVDAATASGYAVLATAVGSVDARCRFLKLTVDGANQTQASGPSEAVDNNAMENRQCWNS